MFIEIDSTKRETLNIAERVLSETVDGKKTIDEIKKRQKKDIQVLDS